MFVIDLLKFFKKTNRLRVRCGAVFGWCIFSICLDFCSFGVELVTNCKRVTKIEKNVKYLSLLLLIALFAKNGKLKEHCSKGQNQEQKVADKGDNMGPASEKEVGNHCKSAGEKGVEIGGRRLEKEHGECAKSYQCKVQINLFGAGAHTRACNNEWYEGAEDDEYHKG